MKRHLTRWLGPAIFVLAIVATGCGDPPTTPSPNPPTTPTPPTTPAPPAPPAPPVPPPTVGVTRILAFGDSMTEGTTSAPASLVFRLDAGLSRSYPFKLQTLMTARYSAQTVQVYNGGRAGNQATADRGRFNDLLAEARPDLVLLFEGANDLNAIPPGEQAINTRITAIVSALEDMVRDAGFRNAPVLIATLPPQRAGGQRAGGVPFLAQFNEAVKVMAGRKGAHVVDLNAQVPLTDIGQDGLHPTEAGYQRIAEVWLEAIRGRFER